MTCRHEMGDPTCTSGKSPEALRSKAIRMMDKWGGGASVAIQRPAPRVRGAFAEPVPRPPDPATPDADNFQVLDSKEIGSNLVLRVQYPSCSECSYEGIKLLVYRKCSLADAIRWTSIDPHFGDPTVKRLPTDAPSPAARFPASDVGWADALTFAGGTPESLTPPSSILDRV
jgi:hypothetical protein